MKEVEHGLASNIEKDVEVEARVRPLYWRSPYRQGSWPLIVLKTEAIQQGKHT